MTSSNSKWWKSDLQNPAHIHNGSDPLHPHTCHCSDRVGRHIRWCLSHSDSLEIQAHKNTDTCWHHLYRWLHSDKAQSGIHQCSPHSSSPGTQPHTDIGAQCQGCPYTCHHSGISPLNKWSHYPGSHLLQIQGDSGRNSRWLHWHIEIEGLCKGCSDTHPCPGCSWDLWSHLGSGRWTQQYPACWCSWCKVPVCRHHKDRHSVYPCSTLDAGGTGTHIHPDCQDTFRHCCREMVNTCQPLLCTIDLKWRRECILYELHSHLLAQSFLCKADILYVLVDWDCSVSHYQVSCPISQHY